eukprot:7356512-Prymnesium_polylepis.1
MEYPEARELSFNRWAESNDIVVLWPHLVKHGGQNGTQGPTNCWDGYGQTGELYDTQRGIQMRAVKGMIEAVAGVDMSRCGGGPHS